MRDRTVSMHDLLWAIGLVVAAWKFALPLEQWLDLATFDEAEYLRHGRTLQWVAVPDLHPAWSPLYIIWYRALAVWQVQPVALYDTNWRVLGALLPVALYALLRHHRVGPTAAGMAAWFFLVSEANWLQATRVGAFAVGLLAGAWLLARQARASFARAWILAFLLLGPVAYARPEFFFAGWLMVGWALVATWRARGWAEVLRHKGVWAAAVLTMALGALWGPAWDPERSMFAFGQHYAYNRASCLKLPPRGATWEDEVHLDFGTASTPWQALLANPQAFALHVGCNLVYTAKLGRVMLRTALFPFIPSRVVIALAVLMLLGAWLLYVYRTQPDAWQICRQRWWRGDPGLMWLLVLLPLLASLWLVYSRKSHYLQMTAFWLYVPLVSCLAPLRERVSWRRSGLAVATLLLLTPTIAGFTPWYRQPPPLYNRATVYALESLPWRADLPEIRLNGTRPVAHYFLIYYLSDPRFVEVPYAPEQGFLTYIQQRKPDAIVVHLPNFHGDASWQAFVEHPEEYGFQARFILDQRRVLFIRTAALDPQRPRPER